MNINFLESLEHSSHGKLIGNETGVSGRHRDDRCGRWRFGGCIGLMMAMQKIEQ
jgi:hypothetical protein